MIEIESLTYRYPDGKSPSIKNINLSVDKGDFLIIRGLSGSGKTTLLRAIDGLVPHFYGGYISGRVKVDGLSTRYDVGAVRKRVALLFQDPENQIVMSSVKQEIAFAMENLNFGRKEILRRIEHWADVLGISHLLERRTTELSGGEKQRVILASILAPGPDYLLLDEPSSQLDIFAAERLKELLNDLNREGITVLLSTHGKERGNRQFCLEKGAAVPCPHTASVFKGRKAPSIDVDTGQTLMELSDFGVSYGRDEVINGVNLSLHAGEVIGLIGRNGSGKSTLLRGIMGLPRVKTFGLLRLKVDGGLQDISDLSPASRSRHIAYLGQYPDAYLFHDTLEEEILFSLRNFSEKDTDRTAAEIMEHLSLTRYSQTNPRDLSTGEKERSALATVLAAGQDIILLDEPTRGMDPLKRMALVDYLIDELRAGKGLILATHDTELLRILSADIYELRGGESIHRGRYSG